MSLKDGKVVVKGGANNHLVTFVSKFYTTHVVFSGSGSAFLVNGRSVVGNGGSTMVTVNSITFYMNVTVLNVSIDHDGTNVNVVADYVKNEFVRVRSVA